VLLYASLQLKDFQLLSIGKKTPLMKKIPQEKIMNNCIKEKKIINKKKKKKNKLIIKKK
jgi:hypothetical protein